MIYEGICDCDDSYDFHSWFDRMYDKRTRKTSTLEMQDKTTREIQNEKHGLNQTDSTTLSMKRVNCVVVNSV